MSYVRYIDKTREYYRSEGYTKDYAWAHFDEVPFTPLRKPLSQSRVTIVTTSDLTVREDEAVGPHATQMGIGKVYSINADTPVSARYSAQEHFDRHATSIDDVDSFVPFTALRAARDAGRIGAIADAFHGVHTSYSKRRTLEVDAAEVIEKCRADDVDVVVLTPI